jgi:hypothetical protein
MMDLDTIRQRLQAVLASDYDERARRDIAFHMTDWLSELRALVGIYEDPTRSTDDEISSALMDFLIHAPAHIAAASKLYTGAPVTDVFEIGAVEGNQSST